MRRRLSDSCGIWPLYGPPISSTENDQRRADVAVVIVSPDRNAIGTEPFRLCRVRFHCGDGDLVQPGFQRDAHLEVSSAVNSGLPVSL